MDPPAPAAKATWALFDFDGTITYCDTLLPFLHFSLGPSRLTALLASCLPRLTRYLVGSSSRQEVKEALLTQAFGGCSHGDFKKLCRRFAKEKLPCYVRKKALERLRWHSSAGHRCLLVSANLEDYLDPWAQAHGFEQVVASRLAEDEQGRLTGKLLGNNCRGEEKVHRLRQLMGLYGLGEESLFFAYGDSPGDWPLLRWADLAFYRTL